MLKHLWYIHVSGKNESSFSFLLLTCVRTNRQQKSILSTFYASAFCMKFWRKRSQSCVLGWVFGAKISYEKRARKTWMKLTSGADFINILRAAFAHLDSKSVRRYWGFDWIIMLSGSTCVKNVCRMLMKLSPGVDFINILQAVLPPVDFYWSFCHIVWNI